MSECIHCNALALEIRELRAALGLSGNMTERRAIARVFGLTPQQAKLAQALYDAGGRVVPRETLDSFILSEEAAEDGSDSLKVVICRLRAKIGKDAIETFDGHYAMTQVGRSLIASALKIGPQHERAQ